MVYVRGVNHHVRARAQMSTKSSQLTCKFLWDTKKINLNASIGWSELSERDKDQAIDVMMNCCEPLQLDWGNLLRPVLRWKLYHLHRTARLKIQRREGYDIDLHSL